MSDIDKI